MRIHGVVVLLLFASGCATARRVTLDTGHGPPIVYAPPESEQIEIDEEAFKSAVLQLVLDLKLDVSNQHFEQIPPHSLLASVGGVIDDAQAYPPPTTSERFCQQQSLPTVCLSLLSGGFPQERMERRMMALSFALDTVWSGVDEAVRDVTHPLALRLMVVSTIGTALVMLVAPEPVTKVIAIGLTASLIAYLGTGPVWHLGRGFLRLLTEADAARDLPQLKEAGHRFGKLLGDNGARVLIIVAMSALGGKTAMATHGPRWPGAAQATMRAQTEGGFLLSAALAGEVRSISLSSARALNVVLAPTAVAAMAMGPGSDIPGDPEGDVHHICTDKNEVSDASGGPWTPLYEPYFHRARLGLNDPANKVRIQGHKGPHPREYHQAVLDRIDRATKGCRGPAQCHAALVEELAKIARELLTQGSALRNLITGHTKG